MTAEPKQAVLRDYIVLRDNSTVNVPPTGTSGSTSPLDGTLAILKTVKAKSPHDAIRQVADKTAGTYRAVLAKSFAPVKVTVKTETRITLG